MNLSQFMFNVGLMAFFAFVYWAKSGFNKQMFQKVQQNEGLSKQNRISAPIQQSKTIVNPSNKNPPTQNDHMNSCLRACKTQEPQRQAMCINSCVNLFLPNTQNSPPPVILFQMNQKESECSNTHVFVFTFIVFGNALFLTWLFFQHKCEIMKKFKNIESQVERQNVAAEINHDNYRDNLNHIFGNLISLEEICKKLAIGQGLLAEKMSQFQIGYQNLREDIYRLRGEIENERNERVDFQERQIGFNHEICNHLEGTSRRVKEIENRPPTIKPMPQPVVIKKKLCIIS